MISQIKFWSYQKVNNQSSKLSYFRRNRCWWPHRNKSPSSGRTPQCHRGKVLEKDYEKITKEAIRNSFESECNASNVCQKASNKQTNRPSYLVDFPPRRQSGRSSVQSCKDILKQDDRFTPGQEIKRESTKVLPQNQTTIKQQATTLTASLPVSPVLPAHLYVED